jgi:hypothetical protein
LILCYCIARHSSSIGKDTKVTKCLLYEPPHLARKHSAFYLQGAFMCCVWIHFSEWGNSLPHDCFVCRENMSHLSVFCFEWDWNLDTSDNRKEIPENFEMWCQRRMIKISRTERVRNEVWHRGKEERHALHNINRRNANWVGHLLRRNCLLKHVIDGKIGARI